MTAPAYSFEIVCLANSRKHSGRCVAGKIIAGPQAGAWVRPVSARPSAEISGAESRLANGALLAVRDVVRVPLAKEAPHPYQPENHVIDRKFRWPLTGRLGWNAIADLTDAVHGPLWANLSSSRFGLNDRVHDEHAPETTRGFGSLKLLRVNKLTISVALEGQAESDNKRRARGIFTYSGYKYRLMITDPPLKAAIWRPVTANMSWVTV